MSRPRMNSKQARQAYLKSTRTPRVSREEQRRIEREEQEKIKEEFARKLAQEKAEARAAAAREKKKYKDEKKKQKDEKKRQEKKKQGLPLATVRPSQDTISRFTRRIAAPNDDHETTRRKRMRSLDAVAEDEEPSAPITKIKDTITEAAPTTTADTPKSPILGLIRASPSPRRPPSPAPPPRREDFMTTTSTPVPTRKTGRRPQPSNMLAGEDGPEQIEPPAKRARLRMASPILEPGGHVETTTTLVPANPVANEEILVKETPTPAIKEQPNHPEPRMDFSLWTQDLAQSFDDFFPSATQLAREIEDVSPKISTPTRRQPQTEAASPRGRKTTPSPGTPHEESLKAPLPDIEFLCTQDLELTPQDLREIETEVAPDPPPPPMSRSPRPHNDMSLSRGPVLDLDFLCTQDFVLCSQDLIEIQARPTRDAKAPSRNTTHQKETSVPQEATTFEATAKCADTPDADDEPWPFFTSSGTQELVSMAKMRSRKTANQEALARRQSSRKIYEKPAGMRRQTLAPASANIANIANIASSGSGRARKTRQQGQSKDAAARVVSRPQPAEEQDGDDYGLDDLDDIDWDSLLLAA